MAQKSGDAVPVMDSTETNMTDKAGKKTAAAPAATAATEPATAGKPAAATPST